MKLPYEKLVLINETIVPVSLALFTKMGGVFTFVFPFTRELNSFY